MNVDLVYVIMCGGLAFTGYVIGRWSDNYLNIWLGDPPSPHHWIYGLALMILGPVAFGQYAGVLVAFFGFGLFISDLSDFLHLKFYGRDNKDKTNRTFWHID